MDWAQYWFMFPVAMCVATAAMLSGIGGAALFIPIFVIIFPILGPEYPLATSAAIGAALMTEVFGFSSGLVGYYRKRLIDFQSALPFIFLSIPVAIVGALLFGLLQEQEIILKGAYALLMLILCPIILRHTPPRDMLMDSKDNDAINADAEIREITGRDGNTFRFRKPRQGITGGVFTSIGSFMTGFLGVGVGEVILPQLVKRNRVPVAVAAATSVLTVIVTIASASFTQIAALIEAGGLSAVPWNLVCYTIPAVIIGGQIGPLLQGRIEQRKLEKAIAILFGIIGFSMAWIVIKSVL
ncbi:MAG: sulfite exporter TauE/SafE family protein [Pseudomonadota bacterium]|nr:sulfite exporter TauE/SafE family protein [Pseudomonadota bacterium]